MQPRLAKAWNARRAGTGINGCATSQESFCAQVRTMSSTTSVTDRRSCPSQAPHHLRPSLGGCAQWEFDLRQRMVGLKCMRTRELTQCSEEHGWVATMAGA